MLEIKDLFNPLNVTGVCDKKNMHITDGVITGIQTYHRNNKKPTLDNLTSIEYWFERYDNKRGFIFRSFKKLRKSLTHIELNHSEKWRAI